MDNKTWRKKLKRFRKERGLTEKELSKLSGVSQSQINHLENGNRDFTQKVLTKLLKTLKKDYWDIFCPEELEKMLIHQKRSTDSPSFDPLKHRKISSKITQLFK